MSKRVPSTKRFKGHAETPFIVGFLSLVSGLVWATILVAKHEEYALYLKVLIFLSSPFVGLFFFIVCVAVIFALGSAGAWADRQIAKRRRSRKN